MFLIKIENVQGLGLHFIKVLTCYLHKSSVTIFHFADFHNQTLRIIFYLSKISMISLSNCNSKISRSSTLHQLIGFAKLSEWGNNIFYLFVSAYLFFKSLCYTKKYIVRAYNHLNKYQVLYYKLLCENNWIVLCRYNYGIFVILAAIASWWITFGLHNDDKIKSNITPFHRDTF